MKTLFKVSIWGIFTLSCNSLPDKTTDNKTTDSISQLKKPILKQFMLNGKATNITANKSSSVDFEIMEIESKKYKCIIQFDDKTLFGHCEMYGEEFQNPKFPDALSITFNGQIKLGDNDNSGYAPGTKKTFSSTLNLFPDKNKAIGEYIIYALPDSLWAQENGTYDLVMTTKYNRPKGAAYALK